ncbi:Kinesin protein KIF26A [Fasciola gigantica]|uniref:Kinesin protein KIF26A n=1 Tax=Fasciola gigantica TaxID=46835 RepID=A0A504YRE4_FASGI|nr:Kinesin protein KIF26A [Fasciola gigantica]
MNSTYSSARFRSPSYIDHSTELGDSTKHAHSRQGRLQNGPSDCVVSRSWHAGCPVPNTRSITTPLQSRLQSPSQSQSQSQSRPNAGFGQLFRTGPLPTLPPELLPGYRRSTTAPFLTLDVSRLASPAASRRTRMSSGRTGRIKVILCVQRLFPHLEENHAYSNDSMLLPTQLLPNYPGAGSALSPCISVDQGRAQITLVDPNPSRRRGNPPVPKQFTFDAVLTKEAPMTSLCMLTITDTIQAVLRGQDGCILTIGHKRTGKSYSMFGSDRSVDQIGIIPCAIAWLFQLLNRQRDMEGIRFSVRVSAVEIHGTDERFQDLLSDAATVMDDINLEAYPPGHYLTSPQSKASRGDTVRVDGDSVVTRTMAALTKRSELRASSADKAAHLLDLALARRASAWDRNQSSGLSHLLFTLHVYQCRVEQTEHGTSVAGGRTRLHFLDLGCGRYTHHATSTVSMALDQRKQFRTRLASPVDSRADRQPPLQQPKEGLIPAATDSSNQQSPRCLSLSAMANVLLALLTGQRHLPFRDSALTYILREAMSGNQVQPCILAHVSSSTQHYTETLQVVQLAAKLSRLRRRRVGVPAPGLQLAGTHTLSHGESTGLDDTASSSMEGSSQSTVSRRERLYRRRYKGPRMGRSSYARSVSSFCSDLDFTSGSEQSCETVIYLGGHGNNELMSSDFRSGYDWNKTQLTSREHRPPRRLGPRGTADGSVDVPSDPTGQKAFSEFVQNQAIPSSVADDVTAERRSTTSSSLTPNHPSVGPVKRMMPRTNATVWPRSVSFRKAKESLDANTETWVDGPKAMITICPPTASDLPVHTELDSVKPKVSNSASHRLAEIDEERKLMNGRHSVDSSAVGSCCEVDSPLEHRDKCIPKAKQLTSSFTDPRMYAPSHVDGLASIDEAVALMVNSPSEQRDGKWNLSNYRLLSLPNTGPTVAQGDENLFALDTSESPCQSASSSSTLEREVGLLPRALSDISERTEETEGLPESSTMPKKSMHMFQIKSQTSAQSGTGNQCLRSNSLEPLRLAYPTEASVKLMELRKQIRSALCQGKDEHTNTSPKILSDVTSNSLQRSTPAMTTNPVSTVRTTPVASVPTECCTLISATGNHSYNNSTNHSKENTANVTATTATAAVTWVGAPIKEYKNPDAKYHTSPAPSADGAVREHKIPTNAHPHSSNLCDGPCAPRTRQAGSVRHISHTVGGNSLLRVAAWVNSIGPPGTDPSVPGEVPISLYSDGTAVSTVRSECNNDLFGKRPTGPTDFATSPRRCSQNPGTGMSTFGWILNSPKSDRIQLRRSYLNTTTTTTSTTAVSASPARQSNTGQNGALFHRPSLPVSPSSTQPELERGSPVLWYNSTGRYFSLEPGPIPERLSSQHRSPLNPKQCHTISPIHQWSTCGNGGQTTQHFEESRLNFPHPVERYPGSAAPGPTGMVPPSEAAPGDFVNPYSHGTRRILSPIQTLPHMSKCHSNTISPNEVVDPLTSTVEGPKDKRRSRLRFLTLPLFRGLRFRNREKKYKKETSEEDEGIKSQSVQLNSSPADPRSYSHCNWYDANQSIPNSNTTMPHVTPPNTFRPCISSSVGGYLHDNSDGQLQFLAPHTCRPSINNGYVDTPSFTCEKQNRLRANLTDSRSSCTSPRKFSLSHWSPWHGRKSERNSLADEPSGLVNSFGNNNSSNKNNNSHEVIMVTTSTTNITTAIVNNIKNNNNNYNSSTNTGGLLASVYRSGRRSCGGAASSGYESMRFGASDLSSLSHPDSASDCSGLISSRLVSPTDIDRCALCTEAMADSGRRYSGIVMTGRTHGSNGSIGLTSSPKNGQMRPARISQRTRKTLPAYKTSDHL